MQFHMFSFSLKTAHMHFACLHAMMGCALQNARGDTCWIDIQLSPQPQAQHYSIAKALYMSTCSLVPFISDEKCPKMTVRKSLLAQTVHSEHQHLASKHNHFAIVTAVEAHTIPWQTDCCCDCS